MSLRYNKDKYRAFCKTANELSIFSKDWWLDAACGESNWDVAIVEKDSKIVASMPFTIAKKGIFSYSKMPMFVPFLGPYIDYPLNQKYQNKISHENQMYLELISQLPNVNYFVQHFDSKVTNWLAFYWASFKQTTRYTYIIEDIRDVNNVISNFSVGKRSDIKKAEKLLQVKFDMNSETFYSLHKEMLNASGEDILYSFSLFKNIYDKAHENDSGKIIYAIDNENNVHSAVFYVWDFESVYFLITAIDKRYRNSGAGSLLIREMLKDVHNKTKSLNFEGSMVKSYEKSYRQFGGKLMPYYRVSKTNPQYLYNFLFLFNIIK
jgi:predicted GNAT family acetyltransferase